MVIGGCLLAAACGTPSSGALGPAPTTTASPPGSASPHGGGPASTAASPGGQRPTATVTPGRGPARGIGLQPWFSRNGKLFVTERTVPATATVGRAALDGLLTPPSAAEYPAGLRSQIPAVTTLRRALIPAGTEIARTCTAAQAAAATPR